jgi:16S rRNA (cytosine1402-N4)-methyltransferase
MPEQDPERAAGRGSEAYHVPVMLQEAVDALSVQPDGVYVDCTFGGGGHSAEILRRLGPGGRLFAFDQDEDARSNLPEDPRLVFVPENFRHIDRFLRFHRAIPVDGILADLGVSSHQFDEAERGFSTRFEAPLDMRMDKRQSVTAASLLATLDEKSLHKLLERYGEVTNARTLAHTLTEYQQSVPLKTIRQLKEAAAPVVKGNPNKYFAQVFQALRIAVNDELGALEALLQQVPSLLKPGGRMAVITFHSLEDRIVKHFFRYGTMDAPEQDDIYGTRQESPLKVITRKPLLPSAEETARNPRARSAKLRVAEKT